MRKIAANNLGLSHLIFYSTVTGLYMYGFIYDTDLFRSGKYKKVGFPFDDSFNGRAKFLTYNNLVIKWFYILASKIIKSRIKFFKFLQTVFFGLSAFGALLSMIKSSSHLKIRRISNFIYTSLAFPIGLVIIY